MSISKSKPMLFKPVALALPLAVAAANSALVSADDSLLVMDEILVTARKQTESLQEVPISINTIGTQTIDRLGIQTTEDVISLSPGLTLTKGIGGQDIRPDIRGITSLSGRSNVAILVDGVDMTTDAVTGTGAGQLISLGMYDLERVEVVRGPQSALFGRNAFGGAINYITKKPSDQFEAEVSAEVAQYETYKLKASVTGPITERVLYRLNVAHSETGGQYDHPLTGADLDEDKTNSGSFALMFLPTDNLEILTRLDYAKQERSEQAVATVPYNSCARTVGQIAVSPFARTPGITSVSSGACAFNPTTTGPGGTLGSNVPVFRGKIPNVDEDNITLSNEGVDGSTNELAQFTALINWEVGDFVLTSNTAVSDVRGSDAYDLDYQQTVTSLVPDSRGDQVFSWVDSANPFNYTNDIDLERDVIFQDLHFAYDAENIHVLGGVEYYSEKFKQQNWSRANASVSRNSNTWFRPFVPGSFVWIDSTNSLPPEFSGGVNSVQGHLPANENRDTDSLGFYASVDWAFHDQWEISFAARYQQETIEVEFDSIDSSYIVPAYGDEQADRTYLSIPSVGGLCSIPGSVQSPSGDLCSVTRLTDDRQVSGKETFYAFNPRVVLSFFATPDVMFFGSVAQGTKPGGFNFDSHVEDTNFAYGQEKLTSYELGWKSTLMESRVTLNGAIFYNDNKDKQASDIQPFNTTTFTPPVPFVNNIGEVDSKGLELSITGLVNRYISLSMNYAYTHSTIKEYDAPDGQDLAGNTLPQTPKHNMLLTMNNAWTVAERIDMYMRTDAKYLSTRQVDIENNTQLGAKLVFDWRIGMTIDAFDVMFYVDNVFDDDTPASSVTFVDFQQQFQDMVIAYPAQKRTAGLRLKYLF